MPGQQKHVLQNLGWGKKKSQKKKYDPILPNNVQPLSLPCAHLLEGLNAACQEGVSPDGSRVFIHGASYSGARRSRG